MTGTRCRRWCRRGRRTTIGFGTLSRRSWHPICFSSGNNRTVIMGNILSQRWLLNRRHFLRGVGVAVALPLLDCMQPLRAAAAEAAGTPDKPRRAVFVYIPNGVNVL